MAGPFIWGPSGPINIDAPATGIVTSDASGNITSTATTGSGNVVLATAPTMSNPVVGTQATTDNSTKAASTAYVTTAVANAVAGVNPAVAVQAATTAAGDTSGFTYNNGVGGIGATFTGSTNTAVTIDGFTFTTVGQRLLVKNDTQSPSGAFNGIYYVTQIQTALLPPILTRALDYDQPSDINNTGAIPVVNGTVNGTTSWLLTSAVNTVGTDPLTYTKFSVNPSTILINPMTTLGDTIYENSTPAPARLAGNTTAIKNFLSQTGTGSVSAAPGWSTLTGTDVTFAGAGVKNYLSNYTASTSSNTPNTGNGNFELGSTTGWSLGTTGTLTNGIPTGSPTFGSGASGNLSISTVTSGSQISGNYSLSYVSSAATTAGNMLASSAFFIDAEDQAKVLTFKLYYTASSGGSNANWSGTSSNSFGIAVYDVTNSTWLGVAGVFNLVQSSGVGYSTGTFQTAINTTQIRFVFYNVNATSGAITVYLDDIFVGPQTAPSGPVITDWVQYTPTFTGFGTATNINFYSRRVGDSLEVWGQFTTGTTTGTAAQITLGYNGGNANVTINSSKITSSLNNVVGEFGVTTSSTTYFTNMVIVTSSTTNFIEIGNQTSTTSVMTPANGSAIAASAQNASIHFTVPISGWSSNTSMSADTDTRVVAFSSFGTTTGITSGTSTLSFSSVNTDTHAGYNGTNTYTIPVSGYYDVSFVGYISPSASGGGTASINVSKNGSTLNAAGSTGTPAAGQNYAISSIANGISCKVGDTITTVATQNNGGTDTCVGTFSVMRRSGPAVVTATESVNAAYRGPSQSIPNNTTTVLTGWTLVADSHNAFNNSTGLYTVPVSGKYSCSFFSNSAVVAWTAAETWSVITQQNGSTVSNPVWYGQASATVQASATSTIILSCLAGDTIAFAINHSRGSNTSTQGANQTIMAITRVGN